MEERRKFGLALFLTICNVTIFLIAMLNELTTEIGYMIVGGTISAQTLIVQYFFRKKSPETKGGKTVKKG